MLRYSTTGMAWILSSLLLLAPLGCGGSAEEPAGTTAAIGSGTASTGPVASVPSTVEISTSSPYTGEHGTPPVAYQPNTPRPTGELHPQLLIKTSMGDITVELDSEASPMTVENFITYVSDGFYDETVFHYVEQGYMISAGGFKENGESEETRAYVLNEAHNGLKNERGTLAMARDPQYKHSAAAQFFINLVDNESLDHKSDESDEAYGYCVFGKVINGMDVVDKIAAAKVTNDDVFVKRPVESITINAIERLK